jgi:site-specific recombinase XerD
MDDDASIVLREVGLPAERNPVLVYLAHFPSPNSRRAMTRAITVVAQIISEGRAGPQRIAWWLLRAQHTAAVRARLIERSQSRGTANLALCAIRGVLRECADLDLMSFEDSARAIRKLTTLKGEDLLSGRPLTDDELRRLYEACGSEDSLLSMRNAALLAILESGGLRRFEAVELNLEDYRHGYGLLVRMAKGDKQREVPLDSEARKRVEKWLAASEKAGSEPDRPLLCAVLPGNRIRARRLSKDYVAVIMGSLRDKAGVEHFSPHDLRRTFTSDLFDSGADLFTVQKLLGHARADTTRRYDRRGEKAKIEAVERRARVRSERLESTKGKE